MEHLSNAISWNGMGREMATMTGPALAGLLIAWLGSPAVYLTQAVLSILTDALLCVAEVAWARRQAAADRGGIRAVGEGLRFVFREKLVLGAMSLDLLAVFFGGATALLPIFAVGHSAHRAARPGLAARRARRRRRQHGVLAGASPASAPRRSDSAGRGGGIRRRHHRVRDLAQRMAVVRLAGRRPARSIA